jgi:hypothetical protein
MFMTRGGMGKLISLSDHEALLAEFVVKEVGDAAEKKKGRD